MEEEPRPLQEADAVFVTVPDKAVAAVAKGLAETGQLRPGQVVVHTAGALASSALDPVLCAGAFRLSLHPLQTISDPASRRVHCARPHARVSTALAGGRHRTAGGRSVRRRPRDGAR
ncbi:hypothetical protein [Alicyclobacillus macrosporangiidus]|uniref:hypothetical protein n=1 Tax=Alicyclobacillus macrosporangiidus TaxID=392015 RepID=UPI003AFA877C